MTEMRMPFAITLRDGAVAQTVEFESGTLVDLDENDEILMIEVISPARHWPLDEIGATYTIDDDDLLGYVRRSQRPRCS